jgi:hypothetical protein
MSGRDGVYIDGDNFILKLTVECMGKTYTIERSGDEWACGTYENVSAVADYAGRVILKQIREDDWKRKEQRGK